MLDQQLGDYTIVRQIGKGSTGVVFEGKHRSNGGRAAIKVLHFRFSSAPELLKCFMGANCGSSHPGLAWGSGRGELPDGRAYFIMDYLDGDTLAQRLARMGGRLEVEQALAIARQVSEALAVAHFQGVGHGDLRPQNIMLVNTTGKSQREQATIFDFGSIYLTAAAASSDKPPEQRQNATQVLDKSDVYALGGILHEMLMGERPPSPLTSRERLVRSIPMSPDAQFRYAEQLGVDLAALLLLMLAEEPAQRPSMKEVTLELLRLSYKVEYEELIGLARALQVEQFQAFFSNLFLLFYRQPWADGASERQPPKLYAWPVINRIGHSNARRITIGRDYHNDVVLRHPAVSKRHAYISRDEHGVWVVSDLGSHAGSRMGLKHIYTEQEVPLRVGRHITFGGINLLVVDAARLYSLLLLRIRNPDDDTDSILRDYHLGASGTDGTDLD